MYISSMGKEAFSFFGGGGDSLVLLGGAEVNFILTQTKCSHTTHPPLPPLPDDK